MQTKCNKRKWILTVVATIAALCVVLGAVQGWKTYQEQQLREQKQQELLDASGMYNAESIVLADTTQEQAEHLAELLQAKLRITEDGTYAVLYLPEGVQVEDVYESEEYKSYLSAMSLDYYVSTEAVSATNRELTSARPSFVVTDELYPQQNYLDYINLQDTWAYTRGSGITVAVIDSGIDTDHPDFAGRISDRSYDASNDQVVRDYGMEVIEDEDGHGTSVAGVIAAGMNDGVGITGIAPEVELIVIKCETDGKGNFLRSSDLVFGLAYAIECDADVVNMSFSTPFNVFSKYTKLAVDSDIICVAAAGNEGSAMPSYPAADENVIGVGALDMSTWSLAWYSNYGHSLVLAPGTAYTTAVGGTYQSATGTSISSPIVTSAVALYLSNNPYTEFSEMCELLKASSIDLGILGEDRQNGFGALDVHTLVCEEKGTITYEMLTDELKNQTQLFVKGHTVQYVPEPERENVVLDGWYHDIECTDEVAYYETVFNSDVTLYAAWINEDDGTAYIYRELDDGTLEIQSYTGRRRYLTIPSVLEGKTVTSIGEYAFAGNSRLRSVTLPETLTNISLCAFADCSKLRSIEIPEKVKTIGEQAFYGCVSLTQVGLTKSGALTTIGDEAFAMCGITTMHLPENLESLGSGVFLGSTGMSSVTVEAGNAHFRIVNSALYDASGKKLLYYPAALSGTYTVSSGTTEVAEYAFAHSRCNAVVMNKELTTLGGSAFADSYLRSVEIPAGITVVGVGCFSGSRVSAVTFQTGTKLTGIPGSAFAYCNYLKNITIPASIETLGGYSFIGTSLSSVTFASGSKLRSIDASVFAGCPLTAVELPASLENLGPCAFSCCRDLQTVTWAAGSKLTTIGHTAFEHCTALKQITLPDNLTTVEYQAFFGSGLVEMTIGANLLNLGDGAFSGCRDLQNIYVSEENPNYTSIRGVVFSKDETALCMFPAGREGIYTVPGFTTRIAEYAFAEAVSLTEVVLNAGLTEIGGYAFSLCQQMATPVLPASLTTIGENAFEYCSSMSDTLNIPKSVISIGRFAFYQDFALTGIVIEPESELSRIGYGTFGYCGITDFTVPRTVSSMAQEVFVGCKDLLTVTFEADSEMEAIAAWTFSGAEELRQITFEEGSSLKLLEARSLEGLRKLERVTLEYCTQLTTIDNYAFQHCVSLTEVTLPESLTEIGRYAFNGCKALSRVDLPEKVSFIGRYAFNNTNNLNVYFKASVLPLYLEENWDYGINGYYVSTAEVVTSGNWQYALTGDGKASIVAYTGSETYITLTTMDGHEIVSIGGYAFADNTALQSITLPDTLQGIYQYAFKGTTMLQSVKIPASVAIIDNGAFQGSGLSSVTFTEDSALVNLGRYAFENTKNLKAITIPDGVDAIRDYAFRGSALEEITFGAGSALKEIGRYAFQESALKGITLPSTVEKIDYDAFHSCTALTEVDMSQTASLQIFANAFYGSGLTQVHISAGVEYIGEFCFTSCRDLTRITVDGANENYAAVDGVLYNKALTKLITCPAGMTGSYTVPNTVSTLGFAAFEGSRLSRVEFPADSNLVTLGYRVFYNCDDLTAMAVPDSVQSIDNYAFAYCDNLASVTFGENSQLGGIYKGAFYNALSLTDIAIPDGVQEISDYAFYGCAALTELNIGENSQLKGIYDYAFAYSGVTEFIMPEGLLDIGEGAFQGAKLATLQCNDAVVEIGDYAFADCGLADTTVLEFPETVEYMGIYALRGADSITEIVIPFTGRVEDGEADNDIGILFGGSQYNLRKVTVLKGMSIGSCAFWNYDGQLSSLEEVVLPDTITTIGEQAFQYTTNLKTVNLPDSLIEIKGWAFENSTIEQISLPSNLKTIGWGAFERCPNLGNIVFPDSLEYIGQEAFCDSENISEVYIPKSVSYIGQGAFSSCDSLEILKVDSENKHFTSLDNIIYDKAMTTIFAAANSIQGILTIPEGVDEILPRVFAGCDGLLGIKMPNSLRIIGEGAFSDCDGLIEAAIPVTVEEYGMEIFAGCENLVTISIKSLQKELKGVTRACPNLKTVSLPEGVEHLGNFSDCHSLEELIIPDSVRNMYPLSNCYSLRYVYIGASMESLPDNAFSGCAGLEKIEVSVDNQYYASVDGLLYNKDLTELMLVPRSISGSVSIPEGITSIGYAAFMDCLKLEEVYLPNSLLKIGSWAFANCKELGMIHIGTRVQDIGHSAFYGTEYYDNQENWDDQVLYQVLYIGPYAIDIYERDTSLERVYIRQGTKLIASGVISGSAMEYLYLPDSVEIICESAFDGNFNLRYVRMSNSVRTIGGRAFADSKLYSIQLPETLEKVDYNAFYGGELRYVSLVGNPTLVDQALLSGNASYKVMRVPGFESGIGKATWFKYPEKIIINDIENITEYTCSDLINIPIYLNAYEYEDLPYGWNNGNTVYYKDEWNLATFYADDIIVTMDPLRLGAVVQAPAVSLVQEFLPNGAQFLGWDINGDGLVDELPVTLTEDLEAHAVVKIPVTGLELSETEATMEVTDQKTLDVSYTPSYYNTDGTLVWTSSDETVASVDETGKITALEEGSATITATLAENRAVSASCAITVIPLQPGIRLPETEGSLKVGQTLTLEPRYVLLEEVMDTLAFTSSDEAVATVDNTGTITALSGGTAEITVSCGDYSAVYTLTVLLPAEKILITNAPESMNVGETLQLEVQFDPENTTDDRSVVWTSSDSRIARIDTSGTVTAIAPGAVTITAESTTGLMVECEITVYAPIQWITLNTTVGTLRLDRTKQMEVIYEPSNTTDDKTVVWSSSDSETASVSETGLVTGLKRGTAVITGQVGEHTATYTVTVIGLRDGTTGITVTNSNDTAMREDVELDVKHHDHDHMHKEHYSIWELICRIMGEHFGEKHHWRVYDITLSENGEHIQPDTRVDVEMPFDEGMDKEHFKIYRVEEDGTLTDMTAEIWGNNACFQTDHFSMYVIGAAIDECEEHTFGDWIVTTDATCTAPGEEMLECTVCHIEETREIPALGHKPNMDAATETEDKVCTVCNTVLEAATGHICAKHLTLYVPVDATCTTAGSIQYYDCECGRKYSDLAATKELTNVTVSALGHNEAVQSGYDATCTTAGKTEGSYCVRCNEVVKAQQTIPALGHNPVTDEAVAATCITDGKTEGSHCDRCNAVLTAQETVPATGHTSEVVPAVAATCTGTGLTEGAKCGTCNEVLTAQTVIDALGHEEVIDAGVAATCQSAGLTEGKHCSRCSEILVAQTVIEKLSHTEEIIPAVAPTCTTTGLTEGKKCSVCNETIVAQTIVDTLGHEEEAVSGYPATCTAAGLTDGSKCATCGTTLVAQEIIPALGHTEETIPGYAATCTETGLTDGKKCTTCNTVTVEQTVIPVTGHSWSEGACGSCGTSCDHSYDENGICGTCGEGCTHDYATVITNPTCTAQGYTTYTCNICGHSYNGDYVDALGHTWNAATCIAPKTCAVCNATEGAPNGHNYATTVTAPTCTEQGYTTHTCTACGDSYADTYTDATGHTEGIPVEENRVEPTCDVHGYYELVTKCAVCGSELSRTEHSIPALSHTYESVVTAPTCTEQGYTTHTCHCGERYIDSYTPATGHSYGDWETLTEATCTEPGEKKQACHCGDVITETIPALGHSWQTVDATTMECTRCGEQQSGYRINLDAAAIADADYAFVDGKQYPITKGENEAFVSVMHTDATNLVIYSYNDPYAADIHTQYPTGMRVWMLSFEDGKYIATHIPEFDNLLQYSGSSIRIVGVKGIRMITSINKTTRNALINGGLAGYTLVEYGTALAWASDLSSENPLILGRDYTKSNFAYKRGEADPIFNQTADLIQYTNVLVGFDNDKCIPDIAMRPYIVLEDAEGTQITLYGGIVYRSIGYIAYQNRLTFNPGNAAYDYVWEIIHHVYGDQFDEDYEG